MGELTLKALAGQLAGAAVAIEQDADDEMVRVAEDIAGTARQLVHVRDGHVRDSIEVVRPANLGLTAETGRRAQKSRARARKVNSSQAGAVVGVGAGEHAGEGFYAHILENGSATQQAAPFLSPALDQHAPSFVDGMLKAGLGAVSNPL